MQEIIGRLAKGENVKWVSHLETMRMLERALRRAEIPITYSQGFNPRPRLAMGPALPAGMTSEAELVAFFLEKRLDPEDFKQRLNQQLPPGFSIQVAWAIPPFKKRQTLGDIDTAEYIVHAKGPVGAEELERRAVGLLSNTELPLLRQREKKTQQIDLRPWILALSVEEDGEGAKLRMVLHTGSSGGARPQELLELLGIAGPEWQIAAHRRSLYASHPEAGAKPKTPALRKFRSLQTPPRRPAAGSGGE